MKKIKAIFVAIITLFVTLFYTVRGGNNTMTTEPKDSEAEGSNKETAENAPTGADTAKPYSEADAESKKSDSSKNANLDWSVEKIAAPVSGKGYTIPIEEVLALTTNGRKTDKIVLSQASRLPFNDDGEAYLRFMSDMNLAELRKAPAVDFSTILPTPPEPAQAERSSETSLTGVSGENSAIVPAVQTETPKEIPEETPRLPDIIKPSDPRVEPWEQLVAVGTVQESGEFTVKDENGKSWTLSQIKENLWIWFTEREVLIATLITQAEDLIAQSQTIWSAHVWCYLNRIGAPGFAQNYSLEGILSAPNQFTTWTKHNLAKAPDPEVEWVVIDVFARSVFEAMGAPPEEVGRTLPEEVRFFNTPPDHGPYNWFYYRCWGGRYDPFSSAYNPYST